MSELKFEEILKKLEKIVEELEGGSLSLDDALKKYEEAVKLSAICSKRLDAVKKKIEILTKDKSGNLSLKPFNQEEAQKQE